MYSVHIVSFYLHFWALWEHGGFISTLLIMSEYIAHSDVAIGISF